LINSDAFDVANAIVVLFEEFLFDMFKASGGHAIVFMSQLLCNVVAGLMATKLYRTTPTPMF
jgi:hypothetical protein